MSLEQAIQENTAAVLALTAALGKLGITIPAPATADAEKPKATRAKKQESAEAPAPTATATAPAAEAAPTPAPAPAAEAAPATVPATDTFTVQPGEGTVEVELTAQTVRDLAMEIYKKKGAAEAKNLIDSFGVARVSELPTAKFAEFVAAGKALLV